MLMTKRENGKKIEKGEVILKRTKKDTIGLKCSTVTAACDACEPHCGSRWVLSGLQLFIFGNGCLDCFLN